MHAANDRPSRLIPIIGIGLVVIVVLALSRIGGGNNSIIRARDEALSFSTRAVTRAADQIAALVTPLLARLGLRSVPSAAPELARSDPPQATGRSERTSSAAVPMPDPAVDVSGEGGPSGREHPDSAPPLAGPDVVPGLAVPASVEPSPPLSDRPPVVPRVVPEPGFGGQIFSPADVGVIPPKPLQPLLPPDPPRGTAARDLGMAEYIVDHLGQVESVRLVRRSRFGDSMMPAVIKGWRFEPATRDGQAVKYRQTILLTQ
jgi:hypothetical protein